MAVERLISQIILLELHRETMISQDKEEGTCGNLQKILLILMMMMLLMMMNSNPPIF
jgi:hypothetical protein